jgi:hypothetical protein
MTLPQDQTPVEKILSKVGPRKLLALDSGGIRGLITIEVLAEIERTLRSLHSANDLVLADYFDYIGGTSVGAITAMCLSLAMSVDQIRTFFVSAAPAMFRKTHWWRRSHYKYRCEELEAIIKRTIENAPRDGPEEAAGLKDTLGSAKLRTLLLLVMRNATTDSLWPMSNNPRAKYNCRPDHPECNLKIPLWQLVRASTAAPTYFAPETVTLGSRTFLFDDGATTPYGNPAFQLFLMATVPSYNLNWPTGENQMLLVSVGTGDFSFARPTLRGHGDHLWHMMSAIPGVLIRNISIYQDSLCRVFGTCRAGPPIDSEIGDLVGCNLGPVSPKLFTYLRYDADLSAAGLVKLGLTTVRPADVIKLDSTRHMSELQAVGRAVATTVGPDHFSGFAL